MWGSHTADREWLSDLWRASSSQGDSRPAQALDSLGHPCGTGGGCRCQFADQALVRVCDQRGADPGAGTGSNIRIRVHRGPQRYTLSLFGRRNSDCGWCGLDPRVFRDRSTQCQRNSPPHVFSHAHGDADPVAQSDGGSHRSHCEGGRDPGADSAQLRRNARVDR